MVGGGRVEGWMDDGQMDRDESACEGHFLSSTHDGKALEPHEPPLRHALPSGPVSGAHLQRGVWTCLAFLTGWV